MKKNKQTKVHSIEQNQIEMPNTENMEGESRNEMEIYFYDQFMKVFKKTEFQVYVSEEEIANRLNLKVVDLYIILNNESNPSKKQLSEIKKIVDELLLQLNIDGIIITCFNDSGITYQIIESYNEDNTIRALINNLYSNYNHEDDFFQFEVAPIGMKELATYLYSINFSENFLITEVINVHDFREDFECGVYDR